MKIKFLIFGIYATCFSCGALCDDCLPPRQIIDGFCVCTGGAQFDDDGNCVCKPDFELNDNNECVCKPGYYFTSDDDVYQCLPCPHGHYKENLGNTPSCKLCPTHTTTEGLAATSCVCNRGWYLYSEGGQSICRSCPVSMYKDHIGNDTSCEQCPSETANGATYSDTEGATHCTVCPKGSCCFNGSRYDCNIGTYSSVLGQLCATVNPVASQPQCEDIGDSGSNNNGGGGGGGQCIPGSETEYIPGACTPCPAGCSTLYKNSINQYMCTEKNVSQFCIGVKNCFKFGGIVVSQSINTDIPNNLVCPH